jgi:DNA-binding transcriptional MocR family regulator
VVSCEPLKLLERFRTHGATGMPHASTFPFDHFSAQIAPPDRLINSEFHGIAPQTVRSFFSRTAKPQTDHIKVPKSDADHAMDAKIDIETALQYGRGTGLPVLVDFLREFTFEHMLQGELAYDEKEADIILTCGNTDAIAKVIGAIGTHGDTMLVEEFCYTPAVQAVAPYGIKSQALKMDQFGMVTEGKGGLRDVLENWDPKRGRRPHFMYTVPVGHNPTGATLKDGRRREIYDLCEKFDIIIIEDSPYWNLQFSDASHNLPSKNDAKYPFLAALEKSFLTIDKSGRVIRLDTFSKTIAPGTTIWTTDFTFD